MKKIIQRIAVASILSLAFVGICNADGGYLDTIISITNDHGGHLKPSNIVYDIYYDNTFSTFDGPLGNGGTQAFDFPSHQLGTGPIKYSVSVYPFADHLAGYSITLGDKCAGEIADENAYRIVTCNIYLADDHYPLPVSDIGGPGEAVPPQTTSTPPVLVVDPQTTANTALIAELEARIVILEKLIALVQQLLALQAQQVSSQ